MQILLKKLLIVTLLATSVGCVTRRVVVVDSNADWIVIGPSNPPVNVYIWDNETRGFSGKHTKMILPEGWIAGPPPQE